MMASHPATAIKEPLAQASPIFVQQPPLASSGVRPHAHTPAPNHLPQTLIWVQGLSPILCRRGEPRHSCLCPPHCLHVWRPCVSLWHRSRTSQPHKPCIGTLSTSTLRASPGRAASPECAFPLSYILLKHRRASPINGIRQRTLFRAGNMSTFPLLALIVSEGPSSTS
ncbi:uncharacterized protein B0I36DRAFT_312062 [Microdochium trichocladiopsis]|uniref:Uncharacterized protein n=1 Tax=Microdochium trichocladiopsis TaxID=1682393 RepID=A0A9P9BW75_9PEZI|nr:uncharacterized protein B0I36DRAFT_312062 [Microdochium trichocladiopsis]KAH7041068.1 hypothetical protein B0I36DRAFT_312062 [Microdochium trichocladiopsis]